MSLERSCPDCGAGVSSGARFCQSCGRRIDETGDAALPPDARVEVEGERRQLTVMFCDLVVTSDSGARLDPEVLHDLVGLYHAAGTEVVRRFEGHVAQYLGDGLLAYFAYPQAHEDDAERAVRAGLDIASEMREQNERLERERGVRLAVRIGIHTGAVVIGDLGSGELRETLAMGRTVNLAARLLRVAEPGSVVVSGETLRLVQGLFVSEPLGVRSLDGIATPVGAYRVVQPSGVRSRLDVAVAAGLTALVGRERALATLASRWQRVKERRGQVVLIRGEPGIGKSRLVHALRDQLGEEPHSWFESRGSPYHRHTALYPVVELIRQGLRLGAGDSPAEETARLERALDAVGLPLAECLPLIAELVSLPLPDGYAPLPLGPEARRRRTLEALVAWLSAWARLQPAVFVFEDLHWTDATSLELLGEMIGRAAGAPLLLLATFRPGFRPPWAGPPHLSQLEVQPLTRSETAAMIDGVAGAQELSAALREQVVERTDGVPLFVEELTRSLVESAGTREGEGRGSAQLEIAVPATLQDSLAARLDRLGPAKEVAQLAAVLGREFSPALLEAVSEADAETVRQALAQLERAQLVYRWDEPLTTSYTFKHALVQETAYHSLLKSKRREQHARVARVLEERFATRVAAEPEMLARHCEEGGLLGEAIAYYQRAGEAARERSASAEAVGHLTRAVELLRQLPEDAQRDDRELEIQVALGALLVAATGWGSVEAERSHERARALCERVGETPRLFPAIRGLATYYVSRAELDAAQEMCSRLMRLAEAAGDPAWLLVAHEQMAILLWYRGEPVAALEHYRAALDLYDPEEHRDLRYVYGEDLGVFVRIWMAWALWLLGEPGRALEVSNQAIALGREASHPFSLAYALLWTSVLHVLRREPAPARALAGQALAIAEEERFAFVEGGARVVRAWEGLFSQPADPEAALADLGDALLQMARTGSVVSTPMTLGALADAHLALGRPDDALANVKAAFDVSKTTGQPFWDADLHRIEGDVRLCGGGRSAQEDAERAYRRALEVARGQRARSLELRAASRLAALWLELGRRDEARELLAPLFAGFRDGFDAPDLVEAKALLERLA